MKRTVVVLACLFVLSSNVAFAETRTLNFADFSEIGVGSGMRVSISQGERYQVEATGDPRDLDRLRIKQYRDVLEFTIQSHWLSGPHVGPIALEITLPSLRKLNLSGGTRGSLNQFTVDRFSANLSGGSELQGHLNSGDLDLNASGGSRIALSGTSKRLKVAGSGGSGLEAKELAVTDVKASLSGGSWVVVNMNGELEAQLSGGSHVTYYGSGTLGSVAASGGSRVRKGT
jgi:putative autotransporter adhesin-like protein